MKKAKRSILAVALTVSMLFVTSGNISSNVKVEELYSGPAVAVEQTLQCKYDNGMHECVCEGGSNYCLLTVCEGGEGICTALVVVTN